MIVVDNTFLTLLLHPKAKPPDDPKTGLPIARLDERIEFVKEKWSKGGETVIIPTPVLCEFLILAEADGPQYLTKIHGFSNFKVVSFDELAAVELAAIHVSISLAMSKKAKKRDDEIGTWAKIKFDRQIVSIAKISQQTSKQGVVIYSDDKNLTNFAESQGIKVVHTWDLPFPPPKQQEIPFPAEKQNVVSITAKQEGSSDGNGEKQSESVEKRKFPKMDLSISVSDEE